MISNIIMSKDTTWCFFALPAFLRSNNLFNPWLLFSLLLTLLTLSLISWAFSPGGPAWKNGRNRSGPVPIPGPRGLPVFGILFTLKRGLAHRVLASMSSHFNKQLMAFSLGSTPHVVTSDHVIAREILTSHHFADRPIKISAKSLMFTRAIGFAPNGPYWRHLRKIACTNLFAPRRITAHEGGRQQDSAAMLQSIATEQATRGIVTLRKHLQDAALNNIMGSVFGKRLAKNDKEVNELRDMVSEGFELLGGFNWCDYLPWLSYVYDPCHTVRRCESLVARVREFVGDIIHEHELYELSSGLSDNADFVDILLSLDGKDKLSEDDMIAVL